MFKLFAVCLLFVFQSTSSDGFTFQPKIINGIVSNPSDFPFFVGIQMGNSRCSGSLISDRYAFS